MCSSLVSIIKEAQRSKQFKVTKASLRMPKQSNKICITSATTWMKCYSKTKSNFPNLSVETDKNAIVVAVLCGRKLKFMYLYIHIFGTQV